MISDILEHNIGIDHCSSAVLREIMELGPIPIKSLIIFRDEGKLDEQRAESNQTKQSKTQHLLVHAFI